MTLPSAPSRYHPLLVGLHWLLAALILMMLVYGGAVLEHMPNESSQKIPALRGHMIMGVAVLLLTLIRGVVSLKTIKPAPVTSGNALADRLTPWAHRALYLLVFLMAGSGIAISVQAHLPDIVFGNSGTPLPHSLTIYASRVVHGNVAILLFLTIALHIAAALYHQIIRKDGLMSRMRFGKR